MAHRYICSIGEDTIPICVYSHTRICADDIKCVIAVKVAQGPRTISRYSSSFSDNVLMMSMAVRSRRSRAEGILAVQEKLVAKGKVINGVLILR